MRTLCGLALTLVLIPSLRAAPPERWEPRGAGGGGAFFEPCYSPHNPDELWLASDMSSFFVTRDAGTSWDRLPYYQIQANSRSPIRFTRDPKILWALDASPRQGGNALRPSVSGDGGKTWRRVPAPGWVESDVASEMFNDPERPERVIVSGERLQLYLTRDGEKFTSFFRSKKENCMLTGAVFAGDEILVGTSHDGILHSMDNGRTWGVHPAEGYPQGEAVASFAAAGLGAKRRLFLVTVRNVWQGAGGAEAGGFQGLYVLDPGSNRWEKRAGGLDLKGYFLATSPRNADIAYVAGMGQGAHRGPAVFRTSDGGKTWQSVFRTARNANVGIGWAGDGGRFDWTWPEYALGLGVAPGDPDRVAVTDLGCVHQSKDGGKTWEQIYTNPVMPRAVGALGGRDDRFSSRGLEVTACWDIAWLGPRQVYGGWNDICGLVSGDGGRTWAWPKGQTDNASYHSLTHPNGKAYLATSSIHDLFMATYLTDQRIDGGKGSVRLSEDGGQNWHLLKDFQSPVVRLATHPRQPNTLYACVVHSQRGGVYRTEQLDKGAAAIWTRLAAPPRTQGHPYNLHVLADETLVCTYAGRIDQRQFTPSSGVFVSSDGGKSWQDRSHPGMRFWTKDLVIDPHDPTQSTWYVGVFHAWGEAGREGKSGLYRTTDRGKTWLHLLDRTAAPSGVLNVESLAFNPGRPGEVYVATEYDGLLWTADIRGPKPHFDVVASYPFAHPLRIFFNPHQPGEVWVTSFGGGVHVGQEKRGP